MQSTARQGVASQVTGTWVLAVLLSLLSEWREFLQNGSYVASSSSSAPMRVPRRRQSYHPEDHLAARSGASQPASRIVSAARSAASQLVIIGTLTDHVRSHRKV